jgi:RNA polymerase sigma-70 factor (ECF subfamily)
VTKPDDPRLLKALRAGCPAACAEVVRTHYQRVYRLLVHLCRDVHRAEDLTQETFAAAWEKIATFQGRATLATWLHRIAYRKFVDAERADRRDAGGRQRLSDSPAPPPDPSAALLTADEAERLYRGLEALDAPDRTVLVLHYLQGLSYRQMAAVLDEPTGTVKWRTAEALNRLRILLGDENSEHAPRTTSDPGPLS